jgi:AcrR family transcriptional regulator
LAIADHPPDSLTLVEPSAALLEAAVRRLAGTARTWSGTAQSFAADLPAGSSFDLVESTFALHAIPHPERTDLLTALRPHTRRLAIVEFDVPDHSGAERLRFLARTYERGLAEYGTDRDLVARGFLMPSSSASWRRARRDRPGNSPRRPGRRRSRPPATPTPP